jgi:hypothetical protein
MNDQFEYIVQSDPTLKFFMREATFDFDKLEHQVALRCSAVMIAINKWLDQYKYVEKI